MRGLERRVEALERKVGAGKLAVAMMDFDGEHVIYDGRKLTLAEWEAVSLELGEHVILLEWAQDWRR